MVRAVLIATALLHAGAIGAPPAAAAPESRSFQVRDSIEASHAISKYRTHVSRNEWRAAVRQIQVLLDIPPERGVVVVVDGARPVRYESVWRAGVRLIDDLPQEGRDAWELLYRSSAEDLLARGLRQRREDDLATAARRFPVRDVRRRAHDAMAHLATARGDLDRAARELELLLECLEPGSQAQALARLGFARSRMGDAEGVERTIRLATALRDAPVPSAAGPEPLGTFLDRMGSQAASAARRFAGARHFGGGRHGTGTSEAPPEIDAPSWLAPVPVGWRPGLENDNRFIQGDPRFRPVIPVVGGGALFLNDGLSLTAVDVATGHTRWRHRTKQTIPEWRDHPNVYHTAAVADGVVYAALATRADAPDVERRFSSAIIIYSLPHRALHALDARTGEVVWSHESSRLAGRADAAEIERESAASPPLVVGDDVYVLTWAFGTLYEMRLVCFDRHTGATRWRTTLVHGQQEMNLFGRPVKEVMVPPLAELGGTIYASTGFGLVAAVDRVSGGVRWLAEHDTTAIPDTYHWFETTDRSVTWRPSPISATPAGVVVAPFESEHLFAFDPRNGATLLRVPQRSSDGWSAWFLGVSNGKAYTLGSRLFAWDLATRERAWKGPEAGRLSRVGDAPREAAGRAILTDDAVWVPTDAGIARLSASTGAFAGVRRIPALPGETRTRDAGDLTSGDGALVVTTSGHVEAYFRFDDFARRLEDRMIGTPDDPQARLEAGEIYLGAGRVDQAVACLEQGLVVLAKLPPGAASASDPPIRRTLIDALLTRARLRRAATDGPGAWADHRRAVEIARDRGDVVRTLLALAKTAEETQRDAECDAALARIADELPDVETELDGGSRGEAGAVAAMRLGERAAARGDVGGAVRRWLGILDRRPDASLGSSNVTSAVREAIDALAARHGDDVARLVDAHGAATLEAAVKAGDGVALNRIARTSPSPRIGTEAALAAARLSVAAGRPREAAAVLEGVVMRPQSSTDLKARSLWALATAYRAVDETPRERSALRRIVQECDGSALDDGRPAADAARSELAADRFRDAPPQLADPRPPVGLLWDENDADGGAPLRHLNVLGTRPRALQSRLLFLRERTLRLVDGRSGDEVWNAPCGVAVAMTFGAAGKIVLVGKDPEIRPVVTRLDGVDAATGERLWSRRLPGGYQHAATSLGLIFVLRFETDVRGDRVTWITAVSAESGEVVAERRLGPAIHPQITAAADAIVAYELVTQGSTPRRRAITLDAATLSPRGIVEIEGQSSPFSVPVPGTPYVATLSRHNGIAVLDVGRGALAWAPTGLAGRSVSNILAVPGGVIVSDDGDQIRRIDAATGRQDWICPLGGEGRTLGYNGLAADGDLVAATLVASKGGEPATAVGIDANTGQVRWRQALAIEGRTLPHPEMLAGAVAWELNVRKPGAEFDCRIELVSRSDGSLLGAVSHPTIGKVMQVAAYAGPFIVLTAPPRSDFAVFGGPADASRR